MDIEPKKFVQGKEELRIMKIAIQAYGDDGW